MTARTLVAALALCAVARAAELPAPLLLPQYGVLLDGNDQPLDGTQKMKFGLYKNATPDGNGNDPSWWESTEATVSVAKGRYSILLGHPTSGTGALTPAAFEGPGDRWLEVTVNGQRLTPRLRIGSTVFALQANRAAEADALTSKCNGCVATAHLADKAITLAKLDADAQGHLAGLSADTLDGFDSSAFAPAAITADVTAIKEKADSLLGKATSIEGKVDTANGVLTTLAADTLTLKADTTALKADTTALKADTTTLKADATTLKADTTTLKADTTTLKADTTTLKADTTALKADTTTLKADTTTLKADTVVLKGLTGEYSKTCTDFAAKGWKNLDACLQDGRWHLYANITKSNGNQARAPGGLAAFYAASQNGADTKIRLGIDWYNVAVRSTDSASAFWIFLSDFTFTASFVARANGTITDIHISDPDGGHLSHDYNDNFRTDSLGNRHYLSHWYHSKGEFSNLDVGGGVDFWARY